MLYVICIFIPAVYRNRYLVFLVYRVRDDPCMEIVVFHMDVGNVWFSFLRFYFLGYYCARRVYKRVVIDCISLEKEKKIKTQNGLQKYTHIISHMYRTIYYIEIITKTQYISIIK